MEQCSFSAGRQSRERETTLMDRAKTHPWNRLWIQIPIRSLGAWTVAWLLGSVVFLFAPWAILTSAVCSAPSIPVVAVAIVLAHRCRPRAAKLLVLTLGGVVMWTIATLLFITDMGQDWNDLTPWPAWSIRLTLPYLFSAVIAMTWIGWVNAGSDRKHPES